MTLAQHSPRVAELLGRMRANRGRLVFALDATMSRQETWDTAAQLTADMFLEATKVGALDIQLIYFRGTDEVKASEWFSDAYELVRRMGTIRCEAGSTKITRVLRHIRAEHQREKIGAAVFVGDAVEESPQNSLRRRGWLSTDLCFSRRRRLGRCCCPARANRRR